MFVLFALITRFDGGDIVIGGGYNSTEASFQWQAMRSAMEGTGILSGWNDKFWCSKKYTSGWVICCEDVCGGIFSVYRFSFTLCIFFAFLTLCTIGSSKFGARVHRGFWFVKVLTLIGLLVSTLFIHNDAMQGYREAARYFSFLFLLMQILLLIDFGYGWNERWLQNDEASESNGWKIGILVSAAVLFIGSIAGWVLLYVQFGHSDCPAQQALISVTLILTVILTIISCTKIAPHGTLLTSGVVTAYATYLCYSALASHPDTTCNPYANRDTNSILDMLAGLLVAAISMACTAWSATGSKDALIGKEPGSDLTQTLEDGSTKESSSHDDKDEELGSESWWYYHLMMVACSMYMAMLLTDWSSQPWQINGVPLVNQDHAFGHYNTSLGSFWVKVVSQWVCLLMYAWTLLAPYIFRNTRDFGVEFDLD